VNGAFHAFINSKCFVSLFRVLQVLGVYTTQLHGMSSALPATLLVGDETAAFSKSSEEETSDVDVDC